MTAYTIRRLIFALFVLWGAVTLVFLVLRLVPGDPASVLVGADASAAEIALVRERLGLDEPLLTQYRIYLQSVARLDFGFSYRLREDAMGVVISRLPATVRLATTAMAMSILVGVPLGVAAARRPNGKLDRAITTLSLATQSLPTFWVGIVLILLFAGVWGLLPSSGSGTLLHLVLPATTLALPFLALLVRMVRSGLLEVIHEDYVRTARAKGLPEHAVLAKHAIRNALIPVVTVVGLQFGTLLSGTVIVETVFAWPGIGRQLVSGIENRDYPVVQAAILVIAVIFTMVNLAVDILYTYLDPRAREQLK